MSKKGNFIWASYADLMTTLFFIMLVLFVLTIVILKNEQGSIVSKLEEFQKIEEIKKTFEHINKDYFEYRTEYKKHVLKLTVKFPSGSSSINSIIDSKIIIPQLENAGREILNTINRFSKNDNIQYLVIIEGQASKDGFSDNDILSYNRALNLKLFWKDRGIDFDQIENCELIVAGSGEGGIPREQPDWKNEANQRFLIHIIPKTGEIVPN